jgi:hypothetical protein
MMIWRNVWAISVPTFAPEGDANGAPQLDPVSCHKKFSGEYAHRTIEGGIGHNLSQEAPRAFAQEIIDADDCEFSSRLMDDGKECVAPSVLIGAAARR